MARLRVANMTTAIVTTQAKLSAVIGEVRDAFKATGWLRVSWRHEKDRTLQQNALSHAWYEQIAAELREDTAANIKAECKLRYGVTILRAEDAEFRAMYDGALKAMTYEQKLAVMHYLPITSIMTTTQLSQYLEAVRKAYDGRVRLEFPDDARWAT